MAKETLYKYIRDRSSDLDYGYKLKTGAFNPIHCNDKEDIRAFLYHERNWLGRITNKKFDAHFRGEETYYFTGNQDGPETFFTIDIDCHKHGTREGARAVEESLKSFFGSNLYSEPSTNGVGGHANVVLINRTLSAQATNDLYLRLRDALRSYYLVQHSFDISDIEINGLCPLIIQDDAGDLHVTCGSNAKVPRHATLEDLKATPHLTPEQIEEIIEALMKNAPVEAEAPEVKKVSGSISGKCVKPELTPAFTQYAAALLNKYDECIAPVAVLPFGECDTSSLLIAPSPLQVYRDADGTPYLQTQTKQVKKVMVEDLGYTMQLLLHCSLNMEKNGAMPTARIRALWESCYETGDFTRKFDGSVYKVCRDFLDSMGWIDWQDNTYLIGSIVNGKYEKGVACKWQLTKAAIQELLALKEAAKEELITLDSTKGKTHTSSMETVLSLIEQITIKPTITTPVCLTQTITWWDYEAELIQLFQQAA